MKADLPIYQIEITNDSDQGVSMISLVDEPAIQVDFIKLAKEEVEKIYFSAKAKDRQMLFGPFLIPDQLIYRYNEQLGEYYVRFSKESIQMIADKFNEDLNNNNINFQHSNLRVAGYVASNWVISGEKDQSQNYGFQLPEGTWFGGVKIKDENFWNNEVKSDIVKGFSVEIKAELALVMSKNKQKTMENEIVTTTVVETELALPGVPETGAPTTPADAEAPAANEPLTADAVMQMIDVKFQSLNDEILAIREELDKLIAPEGEVEVEEEAKKKRDAEYAALSEKVKSIEEKLSTTPGAPSIKKTADAVLDDKFNDNIDRLRKFAKVKPI